MGRVLVTGMSAGGKSTVLGALAGRGHRVVDADSDGYIDEHTVEGQAHPEPLLSETRLSRLLNDHTDGHLFLAATAANQGAFYARFDAVVLLTAPLEVITWRLARRTTNDFGKTEHERERIIRDIVTVEPVLRRHVTHEIDTRRPISEVVDLVESPAGGGW